MKIGNIETKNNVFLAPMAGITDLAFRQVCEKYGAGAVYSEMVSAKGLYYKDKKTAELMKGEHSVPYGIQIFGSEPDIMGEIAPEAASYGDFLDINMGCPTPKIVGNGDGSALLKNPKLAGEVVKAVSRAVNVPVTVKMRIGWDSIGEALEFAKILEANGASAIAVHGRTRAQFYSGNANWSEIKKVAEAVKIPVIGNGDIRSGEDANRMLEETGAGAIMLGRITEGNPFIFRQVNEYLEGGKTKYYPTEQERINEALSHIKLLCEYKGEERAIKEARKHLAWYIKGMKNNAEYKLRIFKATKYNEIVSILMDF